MVMAYLQSTQRQNGGVAEVQVNNKACWLLVDSVLILCRRSLEEITLVYDTSVQKKAAQTLGISLNIPVEHNREC